MIQYLSAIYLLTLFLTRICIVFKLVSLEFQKVMPCDTYMAICDESIVIIMVITAVAASDRSFGKTVGGC